MKLLACRLPYAYRMVYWDLASVPAASRREVEGALGINRSRTLPTILRRLAKLGLIAEPRRGRLEARPPSADLRHLFVWKKTPAGGDWQDDLAYVQVRLREKGDPLPQFALCLLGLLKALPHPRQSHAGLAKLLGASRKRLAPRSLAGWPTPG